MMKFNEALSANINLMPGALGDSIGALQAERSSDCGKPAP